MCEEPALKSFFGRTKFERWIYAPLDAEGPNGKLSYPLIQSLLGFDRILAYGRWGESVIRKALGDQAAQERELSSIPHGIDSSVFYPRDRAECRNNFFRITHAAKMRGQMPEEVSHDEVLIGTIATNQARKDWGLWARACSAFLIRHPKTYFWVHVDRLEKDWSIPALLIDFGLLDKTVISLGHLEDDQMAQAYSACDLTLGIGPEGFGYPAFESLFCGTRCVTGNYGGAPEHMGEHPFLVQPIAFKDEGLYCSRRPVYDPKEWALYMEDALARKPSHPGQLDWTNVWAQFEEWFRKGLSNV
jgi:glycosyltransferase involved in cell wall biosynthesis